MSASAPVSGVMSIRHRLRFVSLHERIERDLTHCGEFDLAAPVQHQKETAADHVAQRAVGLLPVPRFAEFCRQLAATQTGILRNELSYKEDVVGCNCSTSISPVSWHLLTVCQNEKPERKPWRQFFYALTRRHTGAASVSGFPAARSNCA